MHQFTQAPSWPGFAEPDPYAERILDAAREQLLEFGLARTSLNRIAVAAGVSRGTLFNRFPNRGALLRALTAREVRAVTTEIDAQLVDCALPEERIVALIASGSRELAGHVLLRRLLVTDPDQMLPAVTTGADAVLAMARDFVASHLRQAQTEGMPISGEPELLAELVVRLTHSLLLTPETLIPLDDEARLSAAARAYILPMLLGHSDA